MYTILYVMSSHSKKSHYQHLRDRWISRHTELQKRLWSKHKDSLTWLAKNASPKQLPLGLLGGLILLAWPGVPMLPSSQALLNDQQVVNTISKNAFIVSDLSHVLPNEVRPLTTDEEEKVLHVLSRDFDFKLAAELEGKRLNRSYGLIGQEQHLVRYPGDNIVTHFDSQEEARQFGQEGMAPGLGAWGYIGDTLREKYYIAVPTFLAPGFLDHVKEYTDFFKYRKMLVVNPQNGNAIVADIADAGPAEWTGKHLGGSPEVMHHLERVDGSMKGPVVYFFIDDPNDTIPLGPVQIK